MAKYLASMKMELILVARSKIKLEKLRNTLPTKVTIIVADLSNEQKVKELYVLTKNEKIDILINNAGFGKIGNFTEVKLEDELKLIDVNVKALHILTKKYIEKMSDEGYVLNVASIAAFMPGGPLLASYYASKAYVLSLSQSINQELKCQGKNISVSVLCPGPVNTEFNSVAGVKFNLRSL
jgi:short-subunit dehydrogenase